VFHEVANGYLLALQWISPRAPGFCILVRRALHEAIGGFDETLLLAEDHDYVRRAARHGRFGVLTSVRIPVSTRRVEGEGVFPLLLKYLWAEAHVWAGRPIRSLPFDYAFGHHHPSSRPGGYAEREGDKERDMAGLAARPPSSIRDAKDRKPLWTPSSALEVEASFGRSASAGLPIEGP
jgi:hypothetical protein